MEGWANMTAVKIGGVSVEKMSNDVARTLPDSGNFEVCYGCPSEKVKLDVREKLG